MGFSRGQALLVSIIVVMSPVMIDMHLPMLPTLENAFGVPAEATRQVVSIYLLGYALGQLLVGPLSDRIGRRPVILGGMALLMIASFAALFATSFTLLLTARAIQAVGVCAATVGARATVQDVMPPREAAKIFSFMLMIGGIAPVIAPVVGSLLTAAAGWRGMFLLVILLALLLFLAAARMLPESRTLSERLLARQENTLTSYRAVAANRLIQPYLIGAAFNLAAMFGFVSIAPALFTTQYGLNPNQLAVALATIAVGLLIGGQAGQLLLARFTPDAILRGSTPLTLCSALLMLVIGGTGAGGVYGLVACQALVTLTIAPVQANAMAITLGADRQRAGSVASLFGTAGFAFGGFASLLIGALGGAQTASVVTVIAFCQLATAALLMTGERVRRRHGCHIASQQRPAEHRHDVST